MKAIKIQGKAGRLTYRPAKLLVKTIKKIEKELKNILSNSEEYLDADDIRKILKKKNSLIGTVGGAIQGYRYREELTQQKLAKKSKIPQGHLSEMERNLRPVGLKIAKKLAKALHCNYLRFLD